MNLEEVEDEERDTIASTSQNWSEPNANSGNKVNCALNKGLTVGKKILVFGFVTTSIPIVLPAFVVASAIGLVVSMPCAFYLVSHTCTQNLMSKLLPRPSPKGQGPLLLEDACFKQDVDITHINNEELVLAINDETNRESEMVDVNYEENVILDNEEGHIRGEIQEEMPMNGGTIIEGIDENEEFKAPFELGVTSVVLEECEYEVKDGDIEEEEMKKETKGVLEKIRDEGITDVRGEYEKGVCNGTSESDQDFGPFVENVEVGEDEKLNLGTEREMRNQEDSRVCEEMVQSRNDDNKDTALGKIYGGREESNEEKPTSEGTIMEGFNEIEEFKAPFEFGGTTVVLEECGDDVKEGDIDEEEMQKETKGLLEKIRDEGRNDMRGEYVGGISSGTTESHQDFGPAVENMEVGQEENPNLGTGREMRDREDSEICEEMVPSRNDNNNKDTVCNEVESAETASGILELEIDGSNDSQKPMAETETSELLEGRGFEYDETVSDEAMGDLLIETQVLNILASKDSSEVADDKTDTHENFKEEPEPTILQKGKLDDKISDFVNQEKQLHECNKRMDLSDADAREIGNERELQLCDKNRIDTDAYSYTIDLHEESSNVEVDVLHTDSMEVFVSSVELESRSSECSSGKNIVCPSDEEENIWKHINVIRKIIGYEGTIQSSCADELKALYIFTGVEPPTFLKENPFDPAEINEKLHFLMSIVGVKTNSP